MILQKVKTKWTVAAVNSFVCSLCTPASRSYSRVYRVEWWQRWCTCIFCTYSEQQMMCSVYIVCTVNSDGKKGNSHKYTCRGTDDCKQTDESKSKHKPLMKTDTGSLKTLWRCWLSAMPFVFIWCLLFVCVFSKRKRNPIHNLSSKQYHLIFLVTMCVYVYLCQTITVNELKKHMNEIM